MEGSRAVGADNLGDPSQITSLGIAKRQKIKQEKTECGQQQGRAGGQHDDPVELVAYGNVY